jgi:hypothetical protein
MVFGVLQGGRIFSRGRCGAWCFASGRIHTLASLSVRRSAGGFCMAVAVFGALQGVGCIPWRPLVSATLPVIFGWQVRYLVIFIFIFILYILLPNLILYENNITSHTYIYIYILSACTSHILQITFYTRYIYILLLIIILKWYIYIYINSPIITLHHFYISSSLVAFQILHRISPNITLYYKICRKYFPALLCTIMLTYNNNTSQYYFVLQCLYKTGLNTTLY